MKQVTVNNTAIDCPFESQQHYVAIRSICQALGIDHQKQFERIKNDYILKDVYTDTVYASDEIGRKQKMFCLPIKYIFGWLFSIDETKINERAKPTFIKYKAECYEVLYNHFVGKMEVQNTINLKEIKLLEAIQAQKDNLHSMQKELKMVRTERLNAQLELSF